MEAVPWLRSHGVLRLLSIHASDEKAARDSGNHTDCNQYHLRRVKAFCRIVQCDSRLTAAILRSSLKVGGGLSSPAWHSTSFHSVLPSNDFWNGRNALDPENATML